MNMKKKVLGALLAGGVSILSIAGTVNAETSVSTPSSKLQLKEEVNLIKNGNFDEGNKYWSTTNGFPPYAGNGYLIGDNSFIVISDNFEVKPNTSYKLEFDLRKGGSATSQPVVNLLSNMSSVFGTGRITSPQDWKTYSYIFTTDSRTTKLQFQMHEKVTGAKFNLDNVKLVEIIK
ncbi:hypothetical protein MC28_C079 (plasmid) [Bacillus thuringiensis MC28]|nr:hypothetical protein MC28_C079 [Bacillus thuringiensis MC28]